MRTILSAILVLTLTATSVYADDLQDGFDAFERKDFKTALKKWKPLAEQDDASAQYNLGLMHGNGWGVTQDYVQAHKWFRLSAKQGNAEAQYNLGEMYGNGWGVTQDYAEMGKWYRLSAEQGIAEAQYNLGVMHGKGHGVTQDNVQAHKWFNIARANGVEHGGKSRDIIEKKMTPDQIAEAQILAREWMKKHK